MIEKITRIKHLGIFSDYRWDPNIPKFERFNLIYGWTASGKTTLSHLFGSLSSGQSETHDNLEYKIKTDNGDITHGVPYSKEIRVFNQEYISENIDIMSGSAKPIFILGKENKALAATVNNDEKLLNGDPKKKGDLGKLKELDLKKEAFERKEKEKGKQFTDIAKIISSNTSGVTARNYRKNNAEQSFADLKDKQLLSGEDISKSALTLKQQERPVLDILSIDSIEGDVNSIIPDAQALLKCTVETVVIDRLKENADISKWVEEGLELHTTKELVNCEFCNRPLPEGRISELLAYFNDADKSLKNDIDALLDNIEQLQATIETLAVLDKANLYDEFQDEYSIKVEHFNKCKANFLNNILEFKKMIEDKKSRTTDALGMNIGLDARLLISAINETNMYIDKHNEKTKTFSAAKEEASTQLEKHYLSEIYDDVKTLELDITRLKSEVDLLETDTEKIQGRIDENKSKISTSGTACEEINKQLKTFLGRDELAFEVVEEGYVINSS